MMATLEFLVYLVLYWVLMINGLLKDAIDREANQKAPFAEII